MRDRLFAPPHTFEDAELVVTAHELGLDKRSFETCLRSERGASIREDQSEGERLGVVATPTFFIGLKEADGKISVLRRLQGLPPFEVVVAAVRDVLAKNPTPTKTHS